ncbi:hypothetical protein [Polynucleobacter sp. MWH-Berg-3C6]|uniref:hypothetical protein n=1 Tax=Polynucleobacter sp. MWH-Berg-3C6 TaxID=1855882 RepID=UPI001C0E453D|nr:hypothetical protein [Polynucleobacter sp. MWH-Berg-3C6]MBU3550566.1 hypothetical protein [Polynucleobacter sp. MWH-Berg-3C6]
MNKSIHLSTLTTLAVLALSACTTAKLEARLEANPQCKEIYNAKTGALMPCPGTDKSFYVAAGLETPKQAKPAPVVSNTLDTPASTTPVAAATAPTSRVATQSSPAPQTDCKPTIHKKTGGILPCPPQD